MKISKYYRRSEIQGDDDSIDVEILHESAPVVRPVGRRSRRLMSMSKPGSSSACKSSRPLMEGGSSSKAPTSFSKTVKKSSCAQGKFASRLRSPISRSKKRKPSLDDSEKSSWDDGMDLVVANLRHSRAKKAKESVVNEKTPTPCPPSEPSEEPSIVASDSDTDSLPGRPPASQAVGASASQAAGPSHFLAVEPSTFTPHTESTPESLFTTSTSSISERKRISVENGRFIDSHAISACIYLIFQENLVPEGYAWKHVPEPIRDAYFEEFKKYYWWDELEEKIVKMAWDKKAGKRYGDMLYRWRQKGKPACCNKEVWTAWQQAWSDEKFRAASARQRENRMSETGGPGSGASRHTCGSRSMVDHYRAMEKKEGVAPGMIELFNRTHMTKTDDGRRVYIDERARLVGERLNEHLAEAATNENGAPVQLTPEKQDQIFMQTVTELSKGRRYLYGTGKNRTRSLCSDASTCVASSTINVDPRYDALMAQLKEKDQRIEKLEETTNLLSTQLRDNNASIQATIQVNVDRQLREKEAALQATIDDRIRQMLAHISTHPGHSSTHDDYSSES